MILQTSYYFGSICYFQYLEQNPREAKCLLPMKLLFLPSTGGIGHCSARAATFAGRRSMVVFYLVFKSLCTKWGAACHDACWQTLRKPALTNALKYPSKKFFCLAGFWSTFILYGFSRLSSVIFIDKILAGPPLLTLFHNTDLIVSMMCFDLPVPSYDIPFAAVSPVRPCSLISSSSSVSSLKLTYKSSPCNPSFSIWPQLRNTDSLYVATFYLCSPLRFYYPSTFF